MAQNLDLRHRKKSRRYQGPFAMGPSALRDSSAKPPEYAVYRGLRGKCAHHISPPLKMGSTEVQEPPGSMRHPPLAVIPAKAGNQLPRTSGRSSHIVSQAQLKHHFYATKYARSSRALRSYTRFLHSACLQGYPQGGCSSGIGVSWFPAFAGMTERERGALPRRGCWSGTSVDGVRIEKMGSPEGGPVSC
jgi:hypothetical protein